MNLHLYSHGKFSTNNSILCHKSLEKWIQEEQFLKYEVDELRLSKKSRKRNKLYCFYSEHTNNNVIMKVSEISKDYKFWRKVDLFFTSLFKDYNYNSYRGSIKLQKAGVDTIIPIAFWTYKISWLNRKSYFLYEKIESELTVAELCNEIISSKIESKIELINIIADRCVEIVQKIHAANIRHDDPHGGNILTNLKYDDIKNVSVDDIKNAKFTLIDNDRCTSDHTFTDTLKRFYDLKCLRRFNICQIPQQVLLKKYLGDEYRTYWWHVLNFWKSGGFSIKERMRNKLT